MATLRQGGGRRAVAPQSQTRPISAPARGSHSSKHALSFPHRLAASTLPLVERGLGADGQPTRQLEQYIFWGVHESGWGKIMNKNVAAAMLVSLSLGACATGREFAEVSSSIPKLNPQNGRIYFYRNNDLPGWAVQPNIHLNDEVVGKSQPGGFFYVDKPEGDYRVSTTTEVTNTVNFHLARNETKYVKTAIGLGIFIGRIKPEVVYPEQGRSDLTDMKFIGAQ
ncbi:DUF2846 domain-containing protein [uncultured Bosea sp.]|uniref:DUF2846 domain-containing protein n=1 Tax=uncultured Bosea sp. TaxID=211457 RepID=UPI0025DEEF7E|nr:DUF2846 domain-containing protein [uncultured Bosea sp.]